MFPPLIQIHRTEAAFLQPMSSNSVNRTRSLSRPLQFKCDFSYMCHFIFSGHLFQMIHVKSYSKLVHIFAPLSESCCTALIFFLNFTLIDCFTMFGRIYFSLSSEARIMEAPGISAGGLRQTYISLYRHHIRCIYSGRQQMSAG